MDEVIEEKDIELWSTEEVNSLDECYGQDKTKVIFTVLLPSWQIDHLSKLGFELKKFGKKYKLLIYLDKENFDEKYDSDEILFCSNVFSREIGETCSRFRVYFPRNIKFEDYFIS